MKSKEIEKEINLLDMFWAICLQWKRILLITVFVMIAVGIYTYLQWSQQNSQKQETKILLSEEEMCELSKYTVIEKNYETQKQYIVDSPLMNLNANGYYEGTLQYWIKTDGESIDGMRDAIVEMYRSALKTDSFYEKIKECVDEQYSEVYYSEIVDTEGLIGQNAQQITQIVSEEKGMITVYVRLMDEEIAERILALVQQELVAFTPSVNAIFGTNELIPLVNDVYYTSNDELFAYQKTNIADVRDNYAVLSAAEKELSDNQREYLERLEEENDNFDDNINEDESENINIYVYVVKQMIFACIIIVIIMVIYYALLYLFNGYLRIEDSIENIFGVTTLAKVRTEDGKKKNIIDNFIMKARHANVELVDESKAASMLASSIRIACKKEEKSQVLFTSHGCTQGENRLVELVKEKLSKDGIQVHLGGLLHKDCDSLEQGFETSVLVLLENAGETKYKTIEKELQVCNSYGMTVVGMVVISKEHSEVIK